MFLFLIFIFLRTRQTIILIASAMSEVSKEVWNKLKEEERNLLETLLVYTGMELNYGVENVKMKWQKFIYDKRIAKNI